MANVPDWVVFPENEWQTLSPARAGFLEPEFSNEMNAHAPRPTTFWGERHRPDEFAAVITRGGYLVKRWGRTRDYLYQTASVGKAFTRAALGLAVEKLGLNPDEPVWRTWTGAGELSHTHKYMDNEIHRDITWRHLVDHTAGWALESGYDWRIHRPTEPWRSAKWTGNPMWDMYSFRAPGEQYYSSGNFVRLGHALTALWGVDLKKLLDNELFSKMGIPAERWDWMSLREVFQNHDLYPEHPGYSSYADPPYEIHGVVVRGGPGWVRMTAEDLARFGLLVATGGIWKGERLLGSEWLQSKSGGNSSSVFGDSTHFVAGGRVATDGLPGYLFPADFQQYHFPEDLINPEMVPGGVVVTPPAPAPHVLGVVQRTRALYRAHWDGGAWESTVLDASAKLGSLSAAFDSVVGAPQAFGIRAGNRIALYQAYWDGSGWKFRTLRGAAKLISLSAVYDRASGGPQVFGIGAADQALYQGYQDDRDVWHFRVLDSGAKLAGLSVVYDVREGAPVVFGRTTRGALYQAYWDGGAWRFVTLDDTAGLSALSAVFDGDSGAPQVFGIQGGALYQAYWDGGAWRFRVLDAGANLASLSAVFGGTSGPRHVFGIKANSKALYQASWDGASWQFRVIDENANLTALCTVFDVVSGMPQVFGIREGTRALYQAYWDGREWKPRALDERANLLEIASAFGRARLPRPVARPPRPPRPPRIAPMRQPTRA
jgi:hypothetical protein